MGDSLAVAPLTKKQGCHREMEPKEIVGKTMV